MTADPKLREYATDRQWELLTAMWEHGGIKPAARALECDPQNIRRARAIVLKKAAQHGYAPDHDMIHPVPDGFKLKGTSTLYDAITGEKKIQWVKTTADWQRQQEIMMEIAAELAADLPRLEPTPPPQTVLDNDLLVAYPVGDLHLGMLSWAKETGADWDLVIGEQAIVNAADYLVGNAPPAAHGLCVFLGDFMHYDSMEPTTPTSRNMLDSDGRFPKMVRVAIRCMRYLIERAAKKHAHVHVIIEVGNHDLASSIFLMECMRNVYENEPRITIDTAPRHFHYHRFGKNLIGVHHGHGVKMPQLPLLMAADRPDDWGQTTHRYWWTGHVHHDQAKDYVGVIVESFAVLGPEDAYAANKGYRSKRSMKAIVLHKEYGEVSRYTVSPDMFSIKEAA